MPAVTGLIVNQGCRTTRREPGQPVEGRHTKHRIIVLTRDKQRHLAMGEGLFNELVPDVVAFARLPGHPPCQSEVIKVLALDHVPVGQPMPERINRTNVAGLRLAQLADLAAHRRATARHRSAPEQIIALALAQPKR